MYKIIGISSKIIIFSSEIFAISAITERTYPFHCNCLRQSTTNEIVRWYGDISVTMQPKFNLWMNIPILAHIRSIPKTQMYAKKIYHSVLRLFWFLQDHMETKFSEIKRLNNPFHHASVTTQKPAPSGQYIKHQITEQNVHINTVLKRNIYIPWIIVMQHSLSQNIHIIMLEQQEHHSDHLSEMEIYHTVTNIFTYGYIAS